jgi:hypothetical protein
MPLRGSPANAEAPQLQTMGSSPSRSCFVDLDGEVGKTPAGIRQNAGPFLLESSCIYLQDSAIARICLSELLV